MAIRDWFSGLLFNAVHGNNLVYNACWEDPRLDRAALDLGPDDTVMVITSAGCNALDYALCAPHEVHCVDMNPRQNALLELKMAGIRELEYDAFFDMFGRGRLNTIDSAYERRLRPWLSPRSRGYWDERLHFFRSPHDSFYFHGTSGLFARYINYYLDFIPGLRDGVNQLLSATSLEEQQRIYYGYLQAAFWKKPVRWAAGRDATLSLLGVPRPQRQQVERYYQGGIVRFMEDCLESVFASLPLGDNYFWRVYLTGQYTPECCPEYLKEDNFYRLKHGLVDRVHSHTDTIEGFLCRTDKTISRFVLLDHMDWLSQRHKDVLAREWQALVDRAAPNARVLWRSGGLNVDFVDPIEVALGGTRCKVGDLLTYHPEMAAELHKLDRVHTYGSFYVADLARG